MATHGARKPLLFETNMNYSEAYALMENGYSIRRPCWKSERRMFLNPNGIEITTDGTTVLAFGYREFTKCDDYEIFVR